MVGNFVCSTSTPFDKIYQYIEQPSINLRVYTELLANILFSVVLEYGAKYIKARIYPHQQYIAYADKKSILKTPTIGITGDKINNKEGSKRK